MRKPQDMKVLRALANGPKGWKELLEITKASTGGLSYIKNKLIRNKLIEQTHRGADYHLTIAGKAEFRKRVLVEGLEENKVLKLLKEKSEGELGFFADLSLREESNLPVGYLFYPSNKFRGWLPRRRLKEKERIMYLSAFETLIQTIYDKPKTCFNKHTKTFHVKLTEEHQRALQDITFTRKLTNIAAAFDMCFQKGFPEIVKGPYSDLSLQQNQNRWPHIYERWLKGKYNNNIQAPYIEAMDLLEEKFNND